MSKPVEGRFRRWLRRAKYVALPSLWLSDVARRKASEAQSEGARRFWESLTLRKATGLDEFQQRVSGIGQVADMARARPAVRNEAFDRLDARERYEVMLQRHGFTPRDVARGERNLVTEVRLFQIVLFCCVGLTLASAFWWGWISLWMSILACLFAYVKGTLAAFALWQHRQRALHPFGRFRKEGGLLAVFDGGTTR